MTALARIIELLRLGHHPVHEDTEAEERAWVRQRLRELDLELDVITRKARAHDVDPPRPPVE